MAYRRKLTAEEKAAAMAVIDEARQTSARYEMRDGREFLVVRIPDRYGRSGPTGGSEDLAERLDERVDQE